MKSRKYILTAALSGLAGGSAVFGAFYLSGAFNAPAPITLISQQASSPVTRVVSLENEHPETSVDFVYASEATVNSVVHILSEYETAYARDPLFEYFYGPQSGKAQSSGSGVILSEDGYIVTNNHVIDRSDKVKVTLNDKRTFSARVIGQDPSTDIALLKIEANDLTYIPIGNSDEVRIGEWVLAVGNPFNLTSTVTAGIVSAKARNINILQPDQNNNVMPIESFIQTDAAVNPGNSGGALVNAKGELIGINTAIASKTGSYSGYSFAVPVNIMRKVTKDLMEFGEVQRAFLGVNIMDLNQELVDKLDINTLQGVYVARVIEGGAAALAGLESGDVIIRVGTIEVSNVAQLQEQLSRFRPGDEVTITSLRLNQPITKTLTLRNKDGETGILANKNDLTRSNESNKLGATFTKPTSSELSALRLKHGVKIHDLTAGKLRSAGLKEGFIITHIDKKPVSTPEDVAKILGNKQGGVLLEGVHPNGAKGYYGFGL